MTDPDRQIRRISRLMRALIAVIATVLVGAMLWFVVLAASDDAAFDRTFLSVTGHTHPVTVTPPVRFAALAVAGVGFSIFAFALHALWRFFGAFAAGDPFASASALWLRRAGLAFLANAAFGVVGQAAVTMLTTMNNPPGQRMLAVGFGSNEALSLLMAGVLFAVGHMAVLAGALVEENRSFV